MYRFGFFCIDILGFAQVDNTHQTVHLKIWATQHFVFFTLNLVHPLYFFAFVANPIESFHYFYQFHLRFTLNANHVAPPYHLKISLQSINKKAINPNTRNDNRQLYGISIIFIAFIVLNCVQTHFYRFFDATQPYLQKTHLNQHFLANPI